VIILPKNLQKSHSYPIIAAGLSQARNPMANYMARIELHLSGPDEYQQLDANMQRRGYLRNMAGEDGATYQLPPGTYYVEESSAMLEVALRAAVDAASETGKSAAVIVTDWRSARWSGLPRTN
jgi:hypothetical protein